MKHHIAVIIVCATIFSLSGLKNVSYGDNLHDHNGDGQWAGLYESFNRMSTPDRIMQLSLTADSPKLTLEVADTDESRRVGLMNREYMCEHCGMLFVFDDEQIQNFWMKNTFIPLDMLFFDAQGCLVDIGENIQPESAKTTPKYQSKKPAKYVIEVNGGWVEEYLFLDAHGLCVDVERS